MKKLELNQMENIEGGGYIEGICAGVGIGGGIWAIAAAAGIASMGVGAGVAIAVAGIGCGVHALTTYQEISEDPMSSKSNKLLQ